MKTIFDKPSVTLFTVSLLFSKLTQAAVTIRYGDVTISHQGKSAIIRFSDCDEFQVFLNDYKSKEWILYYPVIQLSNLDRLFGLLIYVLDCIVVKHSFSLVLIPENYLKILKQKNTIYLDRFFCITNEKFNRQYRIVKRRKKYVFSIILPDNSTSDFNANIVGRSGEGNEDL